MTMMRKLALVVALAIVVLTASFGTAFAQGEDTGTRDIRVDRSYRGQPVVDESDDPEPQRDYVIRDGFSANRVVAGLRNPIAIALDASGTMFVAEERRVSSRPYRVENDIVRIGTDGTAKVIRSGIPGPLNGMAYWNGNLYLALGGSPGEIRRINAWTGRTVRIMSFAEGSRYKGMMDIVQRPGAKGLNLFGLEAGGSVWQVALGGTGYMASSATSRTGILSSDFMGSRTLWYVIGGLILFGFVLMMIRRRDRIR